MGAGTWLRRGVAVFLGASCAVFPFAAIRFGVEEIERVRRPDPRSELPARWASFAPEETPPPRNTGEPSLDLLSLDHRLHGRLVRSDVGRGGVVVYAEYSWHWSENDSLFFLLRPKRVEVCAGVRTDCGQYLMDVEEQSSHVWVEPDRISFDLSLRRLDGSGDEECWKGSVLRESWHAPDEEE